jgi:hypothetical protein
VSSIYWGKGEINITVQKLETSLKFAKYKKNENESESEVVDFDFPSINNHLPLLSKHLSQSDSIISNKIKLIKNKHYWSYYTG